MPIYHLALLNKQEIARDTYIFVFSKPENFNFIPGQYGGFTLPTLLKTDPQQSTRRFSILNAPDDNCISIATRIQNSIYKQTLLALNVGDEIKFAGPIGNFILHTNYDIPAVFIAGGIGITPFYSMLKQCLFSPHSPTIYLFYANRTKAEATFINELLDLQKQYASFNFIPSLSNPVQVDADWNGEIGWITDTMLKKYIPNLSHPIFYVCGSPYMVNNLHQLLIELEIDEQKIKVEDFPGY